MKKHAIFLFCITALFMGFISCSTLQQDIIISQIPQDEIEELSDYEFRLVHLDADYSFSVQTTNIEFAEKQSACDALIKDIDKLLTNKDLVLAAQARLIAIKGRVYHIAGQTSKAKECYQLSFQTYKGDIQNIILAHRLGMIDDLSKAGFASGDKPVIIIEQALDYYRNKEYMSSVAKFDEAFISCENYYKEAYKEIRDKAWNLRSVKDDSQKSSILASPEITIGQMMLLTQSYSNIIYPYTAGNEFKENDLFKKLLKAGLLTPALSTDAPSKLNSYTNLTRKLAARYLWNIYCNSKNKPALRTQYSSAFSKSSSPIKDVPVDHEDFDAILGCVEFELMELVDGKNFNPDGSVSGIELDKSLNKFKK
ncbi:MAG: hypothetical protein J6Y36_03495 [Treponema sp.]|nr:hypothetical protein [Treponema sp.]